MHRAMDLEGSSYSAGPALPDDVLPRARLLAHASRLASPGVTLVIAPAGFGKTTLIASWAAAASCRVAWIGLTPGDAGPEALVLAIVGAVRRVAPGFGESVLARLRLGAPPDVLGRALASEFAALDSPLCVIMDDYHEAAHPGSDLLLAQALRQIPAHLRLVIASRTEPEIALPRLRASGMTTEFGPDDLRFTREEAAVFITGQGADPPAEATDWWEATAGWPVALRLFAVALNERRGYGRTMPEPLLAAHRTLRDFLVGEVLDRQPPGRRDCLLRLALLEWIDLPLCAALCDLDEPGAAALLERLVFVDRLLTPGEDGRLGFHALVRATFRDELIARAPAETVDHLHRAAAATLERGGEIEAAVRHLRATGDDNAAVALVERHIWPTIEAARRDLIDRWLAALPRQAVQDSPLLLLGHASWQLNRGHNDALIPTLDRVERLLAGDAAIARWSPRKRERMQGAADVFRLSSSLYESMDDPAAALAAARLAQARLGDERSLLLGIGTAWEAFMTHLLGDTEGAIAIGRAASQTSDGPPDAMSVYMLVIVCTGMTVAGLPDRALAWAREAERVFAEAGMPDPYPYLRVWQGASHLLRFDPAAAAEALRVPWAVRSLIPALEIRETALGLALALWFLDRRQEGLALLDQFIAEAEPAHDVDWWAGALSMRARIALLDGDLPGARAWMRRYAALDARQPLMVVLEESALTAIQIAIAEGGSAATDAAERLPGIIAGYDASRDLAAGVRARVLLALARKTARHPASEIIAPLAEAAEIATEHGLLLPFGEHRQPLGRMMRSAGPAAARIAEIVAASLDDLPAPAPAVSRPLTTREQQMLDALRDGMTRKEIAERFSISPATVKRHVSKIYEKLGVDSRTAAVAVAESAAASRGSDRRAAAT